MSPEPCELITITGWLPHIVRAGLTGLRKKGYAIDKDQRERNNCLPDHRGPLIATSATATS